MANHFEITRFESPIEDAALAKEIYELWIKIPEQIGQGSDLSDYIETLSDRDRPEDRKVLYVARVDGLLVGSSILWVSRRDPKLAEFGMPGTDPEFRRRGIGRALFELPVTEFRDAGGEAIVMGGGNHEADRLYARVGYSKLVGSNALVQAMSGESPEAYFTDYFRALGPATIHVGEAADRTSAVPLVAGAGAEPLGEPVTPLSPKDAALGLDTLDSPDSGAAGDIDAVVYRAMARAAVARVFLGG